MVFARNEAASGDNDDPSVDLGGVARSTLNVRSSGVTGFERVTVP